MVLPSIIASTVLCLHLKMYASDEIRSEGLHGIFRLVTHDDRLSFSSIILNIIFDTLTFLQALSFNTTYRYVHFRRIWLITFSANHLNPDKLGPKLLPMKEARNHDSPGFSPFIITGLSAINTGKCISGSFLYCRHALLSFIMNDVTISEHRICALSLSTI